MQKKLLSLSLVIGLGITINAHAQSLLSAHGISQNMPAKKVERLLNGKINFSRYTQGNKLDLRHGSLKDADIPAIVEFLKKNPSITILNLSWNMDLSSVGLVQLAAIDTLTDLDISRNGKGTDTTNYGLEAKDVVAFVNHPSLKRLNLSLNNIGDEGAMALAKNTVLESLDIGANNISDVGVIALAQNKTLKELSLWANEGISTVNSFSNNVTLEKLNLRQTNVKDDDAIALAKNTHLTELAFTSLTDIGAIALSNNTTLKKLNLCGSEISLEGAKALAANRTLTDLALCGYSFHSKSVRIGNEGAAAFRYNTSLKSLQLVGEGISADGISALAKNPNITNLWLGGNKIGYEGVRLLSKNANQYVILGLPGCSLTDKDVSLLAGMNLKELYLADNSISDAGAEALSHNTTLEKLSLMSNRIHDEGAVALAQSQTLSRLDVYYNPIGKIGWAALGNNPKINLNIDDD